MIETATGIILRTRPLTETSLIVHWLTPGLGRLGTVAKGARRPKSPFTGRLDLFFEADFSFSRSRTSTLHTLREARLLAGHAAIRQDLARLRQAAYATACLEQVTESETPLPEIHALTRGFLGALGAQPAAPRTVQAFELKLLRELGLGLDPRHSRLTPAAQTLAATLLDGDWPRLARLAPAAALTLELNRWLHGSLIFHLGKLPRGRAAAVGGEPDPAPAPPTHG